MAEMARWSSAMSIKAMSKPIEVEMSNYNDRGGVQTEGNKMASL